MTDELELERNICIKTAAYALARAIEDCDRLSNPYKVFVMETGKAEEYAKWKYDKDMDVAKGLSKQYTKEEKEWIMSHKDKYLNFIRRKKVHG